MTISFPPSMLRSCGRHFMIKWISTKPKMDYFFPAANGLTAIASPEAQKKEYIKISSRLPRRVEVISGFVEATLIFALCASFSGTLFSDELGLKQYVALGMQSHLLTATISGLMQSRFSELELSLAAPDIVPTLVLNNLLTNAYLGHQEERSLGTSLAMVSLCTVFLGIGCLMMGRSGLSSGANNKIPDYVFNGFVVSAGMLIFSKAIKMSMPKDVYHNGPFNPETGVQFFVFAFCGVPHGLAMFLQKRLNFSPADVILPTVLLGPLLAFMIVSMLTWGLVTWAEEARIHGWLFEPSPTAAFYEPFTSVYFGKVDWYFVLTAAPVLMILSAMFLVGDVFFKSLGTVKLLDPKKNIDKEMVLQGFTNIICGTLCGVPGYSQMKLAAINTCVVGKQTSSRIPGLVSSLILGVLCLSAVPLVEYVPRFWLSGILYNVAISFIVEGFYDPAMTQRQRLFIIIMVLAFASRSYVGAMLRF